MLKASEILFAVLEEGEIVETRIVYISDHEDEEGEEE